MSIKQPEELGHWKSDRDEVTFRSLVDEVASEHWSPLPVCSSVSTSFGDVVVHDIAGGDGPPVVLLPGFGAPALMYRPELITALGGRPVHLIETVGDVGPSKQTAPIYGPDDEARWLCEVLDGLRLDRAHVVGTSFGGWLALNLALRQPERVRSVVAIEPVWQRLGLSNMLRGLPVLFAGLAPNALRQRAAVRYHQPMLTDARLRRIGRLAYTRFVNGHPRPDFLTDDQLARIRVETLILLGAESEISPPDQVRSRLRKVLPSATVEIVADAGHSLPVEHPLLVGRRIDAFLQKIDAGV
jgi:pimeloyl-ACP methyl ester carboxylesterase